MGVSAQAYADYRRRAWLEGEVPRDVDEGLRVFLQCMELKSDGADALEDGECRALDFRPLPFAQR